MALYEIDQRRPQVHPGAYVADSAELIGAVVLDDGVSVWSHVCIRGDNEPIVIGRGSNVQEGCVLHTDPGKPLVVGEGVTVGHQAMLHGCTVGDGSLVGIQAVVLNGARIGRNCLVGAAALVTEGKVFDDGQLILGSPARAVRALSAGEIESLRASAQRYVLRGQRFKTGLRRIDAPAHGSADDE